MRLTERRRTALAPCPDVVAELTELSYRGLLPVVSLGALGLIGGTLEVAHTYHDLALWILAGVMFLLATIRVSLLLAITQNLHYRATFSASRSRQAFLDTIQLLFYGTLAVATIRNFHSHRPAAELLSSIGTFMMCMGINGRVTTHPRAAKIHGVLLLLVLALCIADPHDSMANTADVLIAMFALAHCQAVQEKFNLVVEGIYTQRKLRLLSEHDPLTGLANRRRFDFELDALCRRGALFAVLFLDLDRFKPVNDTYGHAMGDSLLQCVAKRLQATVRTEDIVCRLGGDEFAILQVPTTSRTDAEVLARRVEESAKLPFHLNGTSISIGISIGLAVAQGGPCNASELLDRADKALYQAKSTTAQPCHPEPSGGPASALV